MFVRFARRILPLASHAVPENKASCGASEVSAQLLRYRLPVIINEKIPISLVTLKKYPRSTIGSKLI
jgi:hypothetical protein